MAERSRRARPARYVDTMLLRSGAVVNDPRPSDCHGDGLGIVVAVRLVSGEDGADSMVLVVARDGAHWRRAGRSVFVPEGVHT